MHKTLAFTFSAVLAFAAVADEPAAKPKLSREQIDARRAQMENEKFGGFFSRPGTPSGKIAIVNGQKTLPLSVFKETYDKLFDRKPRLVIDFADGEAATVASANALREKGKADFALFVVEDKGLPVSLVAPEARWAILNVAALKEGAANDTVLQNRAKVEFSRVFAILCGAYSSQYKSVVLNNVSSVKDLDGLDFLLPMDTMVKIGQFLDSHGVKAERRVPYRKACQEGWAPNPTNDVQKKIWNETFTPPDKPIKIEKKKADK